jgi:hypothetical protein
MGLYNSSGFQNQNPPHFESLRKADEPSIAKIQQNFMRDSNEEDWKEMLILLLGYKNWQ